MKIQNIHKDYLDILFENRNKDYGAYILRRDYNKRMTIAVSITFGIGMIVLFSSFIFQNDLHEQKPRIQVVQLMDDIIMPEKEKQPEPEKAKPEIKQTIKTEEYTTPIIEKDDNVKPDELPPSMDSLTNAAIGTEKINGDADKGIVQHPGTLNGTGLDKEPVAEEESAPFVKVEIEATFPGGNQAWGKYVSRAVERNIDELQDDGRSGTVVVLFVVDKEGKVSDVRALDCQEAGVSNCLGRNAVLARIAVDAVKKGPDWTPAMQNGRKVKAYRRQAVTFRLAD